MKWIAVLCLFAFVPAQAQTTPGAEEKELEELMSVLQEETEIATKTRMNSDYVPGIVTVLHGDELEALGVETAWEALSMIAGTQAVRDGRGSPAVIMRGIDFPFNSGNILVMVNGTPLSRQDVGINAAALLIPIEQVERIEVIRGPGSVVYGDFAFMGLVNVITRTESIRVFGRLDSPNRALTGGARVAWKALGSAFSVNLSRYSSDDAPLPSPDTEDHRWFGIATFTRGAFALTAQTVRREASSPVNAGAFFDERSWVAEARYGRELAQGIRADGRITQLSNDIANNVSNVVGDMSEAAVDFVINRYRRQSLLLGAEYSVSTIDRAQHARPPAPGRPPTLLTFAENKTRRVLSLTAQDTINVREDVTVTAGARYDRFSDLDDRVTPRLSIVWRATDRHILKAQYAEGYRPPTFFEFYDPPAPGTVPRYPFEVNATTELNYVYRGTSSVARATLFRSAIYDMIQPAGRVVNDNAYANGIELEWTRQLGERLKIDANASALDTDDPRFGNQGAALVAPKFLGNLAVFYRPIPNLYVGTRWNLVSDREAGDGYNVVDFTLSRQNIFVSGLDVRAGVKNVFNDDLRYFSPNPQGTVARFAYPGRSFWVQMSWRR